MIMRAMDLNLVDLHYDRDCKEYKRLKSAIKKRFKQRALALAVWSALMINAVVGHFLFILYAQGTDAVAVYVLLGVSMTTGVAIMHMQDRIIQLIDYLSALKRDEINADFLMDGIKKAYALHESIKEKTPAPNLRIVKR